MVARRGRTTLEKIPQPGEIWNIGSRRLHAVVTRGETPAVVLEAGIAATSLSWCLVREKIAARCHVAYDRAGLGWSPEPLKSARPRGTAKEAGEDLSALLSAADVPGPYILVGHSFGGLIVRLFQQMFPDQVAGMVLVDPVVRSEWRNPTPQRIAMLRRGAMLSRRGAWLAQLGVVRFALNLVLNGSKRLPSLVAKVSAGNGAGVTNRLAGEVRKMPKHLWPAVAQHWSEARSFRAMAANLEALPESCRQLDETLSLGDCPVVILSAANSPEHVLREHETEAKLSTRGEHVIVPESGHWILFDDPEAVAAAIARVTTLAGTTSPQT